MLHAISLFTTPLLVAFWYTLYSMRGCYAQFKACTHTNTNKNDLFLYLQQQLFFIALSFSFIRCEFAPSALMPLCAFHSCV